MMWTQITIKNFGTELIIFLDSKEVLREKLSSRRRRSTETPVNMTVTIGGMVASWVYYTYKYAHMSDKNVKLQIVTI